MTPPHDYLSDECWHGMCGDCPTVCVLCRSACRHWCHAGEDLHPEPVPLADHIPTPRDTE